MQLPFTSEQFLDVFGRFNTGAWPLHVVGWAAAAAALLLATGGGARAGRRAGWCLAALWLLAAVHQAAFRGVNPLALPFALAFALEAALLGAAAHGGRLVFQLRRDGSTVAGLAVVVYAAVLYPVIGALVGHSYPRAPVFGLAPCPNTIFTFGMLLLSAGSAPRWLLLVPLAWAVVGSSAALNLGVVQDWGLPAAAIVTVGGLAATHVTLRRRPPDAERRPEQRAA